MNYFFKLLLVELSFIGIIGLMHFIFTVLICAIWEIIQMATYKIQDYANMTTEEIFNLNDNQRKRYLLWLESKKKKKENSNSFNDKFEESCKKYK